MRDQSGFNAALLWQSPAFAVNVVPNPAPVLLCGSGA